MIHNSGSTADTADTAALAVEGPQPVWMTLNEARERAFTGEIVFETTPEVFAYLDNGVVYYAERASDASLGRRLLEAGVVDIAQLERGTVRVGDIEHLGRLFDRDPSVDRDAVIVLAEATTQELVSELANESITTVRFTAYRHHPSGVHRWFAAPLDPAAQARPVSAVAQLGTTVVDDLPGLPFGEDGELLIEWDDEIDDIAELNADVFELSFELAEYTDDAHGDVAPVGEIETDSIELADDTIEGVDVETVGELDVPDADADADADAGRDFEFSVVWPDGSEEPTTEADADLQASTTPLDETPDVGGTDTPEADTVPTEPHGGDLHFTMPPLELGDEPDLADAEVPDDVAEAVRRAIAAIESASVTSPEAPVQAPVGSPSGFGGFAPPTMATSAEVMYAQMEADGSYVDATVDPDEPSTSNGVASVVFVDDPAEDNSDGGTERNSALRRLIGSLRRKDH